MSEKRHIPGLMDEPSISLYPSLAKELGLNQAIVLQQLHFLLNIAQQSDNRYNLVDGHWWVYNSYPEWQEKYFPYFSQKVIQRTFLELEANGFVIARQGMKSAHDRRKWYRIDYDAWLRRQLPVTDNPSGQNDLMDEDKTGRSSTTETPTETPKEKDLAPPTGDAGVGEKSSEALPEQKPTPPPEAKSYLATIPLSPTVVHFKDVMHLWDKERQSWKDERYVYIGRANPTYRLPASRWHNPFEIDELHPREQVIKQYHKRLLASEDLLAALPELAGKILVCWCHPSHCHGDVLAHVLAHPDAPQPRPDDPWYDAIKDVMGYEAGLNGMMARMLQGKKGPRGWQAFTLDPALTPEELRAYAAWYYRYDLQPDGTYRRLDEDKTWHVSRQSHAKLESDLIAYRRWKAAHQPAPATQAAVATPPSVHDFLIVAADGKVLGMYQELAAQAPAGADPLAYVEALRNGGTIS